MELGWLAKKKLEPAALMGSSLFREKPELLRERRLCSMTEVLTPWFLGFNRLGTSGLTDCVHVISENSHCTFVIIAM